MLLKSPQEFGFIGPQIHGIELRYLVHDSPRCRRQDILVSYQCYPVNVVTPAIPRSWISLRRRLQIECRRLGWRYCVQFCKDGHARCLCVRKQRQYPGLSTSLRDIPYFRFRISIRATLYNLDCIRPDNVTAEYLCVDSISAVFTLSDEQRQGGYFDADCNPPSVGLRELAIGVRSLQWID